MRRLRFTREEAEAEASRRAAEFVAQLPRCEFMRQQGVYPDTTVVRSHSSKHPVAWVVVFAYEPGEGAVMDGGELIVTVDLESGVVAVRA